MMYIYNFGNSVCRRPMKISVQNIKIEKERSWLSQVCFLTEETTISTSLLHLEPDVFSSKIILSLCLLNENRLFLTDGLDKAFLGLLLHFSVY